MPKSEPSYSWASTSSRAPLRVPSFDDSLVLFEPLSRARHGVGFEPWLYFPDGGQQLAAGNARPLQASGTSLEKGCTMGVAENKDVIRRFVEEIPNLGNVGVTEELLADDFVLHFPNMPDVKGAEGFKDVPSAIRTAFPDLVETIEELLAEGDFVVERMSLRATHRGEFMGVAPTGKPVSWTAIAIYRLEEGRIAECWLESNLQGLLLQLGVVSAPRGLLS